MLHEVTLKLGMARMLYSWRMLGGSWRVDVCGVFCVSL